MHRFIQFFHEHFFPTFCLFVSIDALQIAHTQSVTDNFDEPNNFCVSETNCICVWPLAFKVWAVIFQLNGHKTKNVTLNYVLTWIFKTYSVCLITFSSLSISVSIIAYRFYSVPSHPIQSIYPLVCFYPMPIHK